MDYGETSPMVRVDSRSEVAPEVPRQSGRCSRLPSVGFSSQPMRPYVGMRPMIGSVNNVSDRRNLTRRLPLGLNRGIVVNVIPDSACLGSAVCHERHLRNVTWQVAESTRVNDGSRLYGHLKTEIRHTIWMHFRGLAPTVGPHDGSLGTLSTGNPKPIHDRDWQQSFAVSATSLSELGRSASRCKRRKLKSIVGRRASAAVAYVSRAVRTKTWEAVPSWRVLFRLIAFTQWVCKESESAPYVQGSVVYDTTTER